MIVPLRCRCGAMKGTLEVGLGMHGVCYCDDCQAYAHALGRADVLNERGGSELWQTRPTYVKLTEGREHLRCLRLSDKGMFRFHAGCCSTPVGNTMTNPRVPFVGVSRAFIDHVGIDELLGPATGAQGRFAIGGVPPGVAPTATLGNIARIVAFLARSFVARAHKPTPFFDDAGKPVVVPRVLTKSERDALPA